MENKINQYVSKVCKGLNLPCKIKKRIKLELKSEIYSRIENGEELDDILSSIGSPKEVIAELESNHENEYFQFKKAKMLTLVVWSVISVFTVGLIIFSLVTMIYPQWAIPPVFGGANGSKAVFIAYKWSLKESIFGLSIKVIIFICSLLQVIRHIRYLKGNKE